MSPIQIPSSFLASWTLKANSLQNNFSAWSLILERKLYCKLVAYVVHIDGEQHLTKVEARSWEICRNLPRVVFTLVETMLNPTWQLPFGQYEKCQSKQRSIIAPIVSKLHMISIGWRMVLPRPPYYDLHIIYIF